MSNSLTYVSKTDPPVRKQGEKIQNVDTAVAVAVGCTIIILAFKGSHIDNHPHNAAWNSRVNGIRFIGRSTVLFCITVDVVSKTGGRCGKRLAVARIDAR